MFQDNPHRRFNPLTGQWVLVSPHRTKRPWQGQVEDAQVQSLPAHDPDCYLCAGNSRAGGATNPDYKDTFVFTNDFAALLENSPDVAQTSGDGLFRAEPETGVCRVICFSPRHDLSIARMRPENVAKVVDLWVSEFNDLSSRPDIGYVQIFENRGAIMGCSNPHPHGQIWATRSVPDIPASEDFNQKKYIEEKGGCMLCAYQERELESGPRVLFKNDSFVALVPYWALWPYEVMVLPVRHMASIADMDAAERMDLADILVKVGVCYDNLFKTSFPYSMGIHQRPSSGRDHSHWHWHIHYYPPLLRSATVRKFMVGYEMFAMPQRDVTPEQAAETLKNLPQNHYLDQEGE